MVKVARGGLERLLIIFVSEFEVSGGKQNRSGSHLNYNQANHLSCLHLRHILYRTSNSVKMRVKSRMDLTSDLKSSAIQSSNTTCKPFAGFSYHLFSELSASQIIAYLIFGSYQFT